MQRSSWSLVGIGLVGGIALHAAMSSVVVTAQEEPPAEPRAVPATPAAATPAAATPAAATPAAETHVVDPVPDGQPRYLAAMRTELAAMGIADAACAADDSQRARCSLTLHGAQSNREFSVRLVYSDVTDTIYMYVDRYHVARAEAAETPVLLRRAMEINATLLAPKLEWNASTGELRVSTVLHTDSNFDRRAFRSLVRSLGDVADRQLATLTH